MSSSSSSSESLIPPLLRLIPVISSTCSLWYAWDQYEQMAIFLLPQHDHNDKNKNNKNKNNARKIPKELSDSNRILPQYFTAFFRRGVPRVLGLLATTVVSCGFILWRCYRSSMIIYDDGFPDAPVPESRAGGMMGGASPGFLFVWYVAGLFFAVAHMAWAPYILPPVKAIERDAREKNVAHLERWLRLHVWRSLTVDLAAWICCLVATVKSFS